MYLRVGFFVQNSLGGTRLPCRKALTLDVKLIAFGLKALTYTQIFSAGNRERGTNCLKI